LIVIAVALIYSLCALGITFLHDYKGCQPVQITLAGLQGNVSIAAESILATAAPDSATAAAAAAANRAAVGAANQTSELGSYSYADAELQTTSVPFQLPAALGLPSDQWRPHIFSQCAAGMPRAYAPCLNYTNLLRGEELVYPGGHKLPGRQCACACACVHVHVCICMCACACVHVHVHANDALAEGFCLVGSVHVQANNGLPASCNNAESACISCKFCWQQQRKIYKKNTLQCQHSSTWLTKRQHAVCRTASMCRWQQCSGGGAKHARQCAC
jgi:hypothetical protein